MNMFGLGVVINATDNMSKGFMTALNTLNDFEERIDRVARATQSGISEVEVNMMRMNNLSLTGMGLQEFGSQISGVGQAMLSPFVQFGQQITATGNQFENYRLTLKALYGDVNEASSKINEAMDLAAKTPFQLEDVMDSVIGFKALGVEVLDTMEDVTGESRTLLEYIGDLASLRPDVGLEGMLYGIRNLLGGDGGRSLRSRLDMDFEQMLGFEWADTTEGMIEQIVMSSQQIANGLMKEMEGSWSHMTSNLEDQWDKFKLSVSDAGAFDSVKNTLKYFYDIIDAIDEDKMATIGKNISSAFNMLWKPIDLIARGLGKVIQTVINLVAESPMLTKVLTGFTAVSGTVLILVGAMTMLGGSVLIAYAGFKGLQILFTKLPVFIMTALPKLASAITMFGKFALVGGALYLAWKSDFMGVRTVLQTFMNNVATAFSESSRISKLGVDDMLSALKQLDTTTFGGWLTYRLTQIRVFWIALCDAWNDYTLSDENFQKVQALGLLPLLETILDLKMKAEAFFKGFKRGFENVANVVVPIVTTICDWIGKIWNFLFPINDEVDEFNNSGKNLDLKPWEDLGEMLSYVVSGIAGLFVVSKVIGAFTLVGKAIGSVITFVGKIPQAFMSVMSFLGTKVLGPILAGIGTVVTAILGACGIIISAPAWVVGAITVAVLTLVAFIVTKWDEIKEVTLKMLNNVKDWFIEKWGQIKEWYNNNIVPLVEKIKTKWNECITYLGDKFTQVKNWFIEKWGQIKSWYNNNIQPLIDSIVSKWNDVKQKFCDIVTGIKDWFIEKWGEIVQWYNTNIKPWVDIVAKVFEIAYQLIRASILLTCQWFRDKWNEIKEWYNSTIKTWIDEVVQWWENFKTSVQEKIEAIRQWFVEKWGAIKDWYNNTIQTWINEVVQWWNEFKNNISNIITNIKDWFINKWGELKTWYDSTILPWINTVVSIWDNFKTNVSNFIINVKDTFIQKWGEIKNWYQGTIQPWVDKVQGVWDTFASKVSGVWDTISSAWRSTIGSLYTWVANKVNAMIDLVNKVPFVNIDKISTELPMQQPKVGLATGGFVKDEGVAMLHPNEVVINDDLTRKLRMFLNENETENPQGRSLGLNNDNIYNNYINNTNSVDVSPITNVLTRFVDNVSNFFSNPLNITMPEFNYPVPIMFNTDDSEDVETPVSYNTTNNEETNNSSNVYNNMTSTLANTTNKNSHTNVSNDYSVTFDKGAIQITVENGNDTDVEKIAQQIMLKIKRQQQLDNTRNYKPSF